MANSVIQLKYSDVTGNTPSSLANGEIAINTYDGKIFYRGGVSNTIQTIQRFTGPAGLNQEVQFNDAGVLGANANLTFDKSTGYFKAPIIESTNNGNGTNFKIGDDAWLGDVNLADTVRLAGQQNVDNAYIVFGASNANTLGRSGTGPLTYTGSFTATGILSGLEISSTQSSGNEGGQINLALAATNTTLVGSVAIDIFQNKLRIFETSGTNRGVFIDLANGTSAGVGTNLISGGTSTTDQIARDSAAAAFIAANSAGVYANGAFAAANAATATDATQNINITSASTYANGAFAAANNRALKVGDTFTGNVTIANGNLTISNTTTSVSNTTGALVVTGGVGIRGNVYADAIFDGGVEILTYATNAYNTGNAAFSTANTASDRSLSAGIYANGAFAAANAASGGSAGIYANGAFEAANSAGVYANGAFTAANSAYSPSNPPPSSVIVNDEQSSVSTFYPLFTTTSSGSLTSANVDTSGLYFVPNTGTFSAVVFVSLSDKKYKKNIVRIRDASNVINKLEGVSFSWKSNDKKSFGVIAQQIEKIIPEAVENNENGTKTVNYNSIIPFLIEAIKQQNQEIEKLKKQVESINKKLGN